MQATKLCLVFLLTMWSCLAQTPTPNLPTQTFSRTNGWMWKSFTDREKRAYLTATSDTLLLAAPKDLRDYFPAALRFSELVNALDMFYEEPESIPLPIVIALRVVALKANGACLEISETTKASLRKAIVEEMQKAK